MPDFMKKYALLIFIFYSCNIWSQDDKLLTISFDNANLGNVLSEIEKQTGYQFYYIDSWLTPYSNISGRYEGVLLETVLDAILKDTILNFYISSDGRIILTRNSIIYDILPKGFFPDTLQKEASRNFINAPLFTSSKKTSNLNKIETIRIGKSNKNRLSNNFNLSGYIKDAKDERPISDAIIVVNGKDIGARTDKRGYYKIELAVGANIIAIEALGMEKYTKRIVIYNNGKLDINIHEKIELLDEVFLQNEVDNNVTEVITRTEIDVEESKNIPLALGERDVLKVATTLPGISTAGEGAAGYNVRGGKSDQNLVLLDDAVIYNPQHFFGIFSALNPFALGDVNIYKNSIPAEYGGRLSSVFDLKTKNANVDKLKGEISIGPVTGNILLETPIVKEKSGLMIGGRGAYANWLLRSLDEESLKNSEASFYDVIAKYNHELSKDSKIEATAYFSKDDFSITSDSLYIYNNRALSFRWDYRLNEKHAAKLVISNSLYRFDIKFDGDTNTDFKQGYNIDETGLKLKLKYFYKDNLKFDYGISSKLYTVDPGSIQPLDSGSIVVPFAIQKERGLESAAFVSAEIGLTKDITLDAGIRYSVFNELGAGTKNIYREGVPRSEESIEETRSFDKNEIIKTYGAPEFRVSGRYLLGEDFSLKASYNKTYQYIHTLSNNTTVSPIDTWKISDLNIKPQSSQQYALGIYKNFDTGGYEMSLEGFYKKSRNTIDFTTGAEILLNDAIETEVLQGNGKSYGIEVLLKKLKGKVYGWLGYTYSRSMIQLDSPFREEKVNNGEFFPSNFDKPHDFSLVLNYKFTKRYSFSTNFVYQTGRPVTFPIGNFTFNGSDFTVFSDRNKFRIPDYYRLDIGINIEGNHKKKKLGHGFWTISVYNVLGRNNPLSVFFVTEEGEVKGLQSSIFSVPVPTITYNLKF